MLSLKDKLNYLMTFCCFMFVSTHGNSKDLHASCEVEIVVRRGETWRIIPQQSVTVRCPVKHCGESLKITWCKLFNSNSCEQINETENVEITQIHERDKLISYLSFKQVSILDDGLYRCASIGYSYRIISHAINISVSDIHQGAENSHYNAVNAGMPLTDANNPTTWMPYFFICVGIPFLILLLTALTYLSFCNWKEVLKSFNHVKGEEIPTQMIPDLPKWTPPSTPILSPNVPPLNDVHSSWTAERPKSPGSHSCENQPSASKPEVKNKDNAVYAVINHRQSSKPAGKQHTVTHQVKNPEYAVINVS